MDKITYNGKEYTLEELLADDTVPANFKLQVVTQNPAYAERTKQLLAQQQAGQLQGKLGETLGLLQNLGLTAIAIDQIATANRQQLQRPSVPAVPGLSPELSQRIYEAQRGVADPTAVLNPARQEIQDAYQSALGQAQIASGGQAGSYQAMANLANIERMKAALQLGPLAQNVKLQNQGVLNDLTGQRVQERQNMFQNQLGASQMAFDQYGQDAQAVGMLGQAGRTNLVDAMGRVGESMTGLSQYYLPFDNRHKGFMEGVFKRNAENLTPQYYKTADYARSPIGLPAYPTDAGPTDPIIDTKPLYQNYNWNFNG